MVQVKNLTKRFGQVTAVEDISFTIKKGEVVGFLGPNGAGKTTTMRLLTGFLTPNSGNITIDGMDPKQARKIIGYLPEDNPLYTQLTAKEYLSFIYKMFDSNKNKQHRAIDETIKSCHLEPVINQSIETLSRGYKQRVGLAATLVHDPKLIIMDEPTTGLDPNQQREILNLIKKLSKEKGVILSTHSLADAKEVCSRVIIIHQGKIVAQEEITKLKKQKKSLEKLFTQLTTK